jgi:hypothetical protein
LEKWKQKLGANATYNNLIKVFEQAGHEDYAENVKDLLKNVQKDKINQTPPSPSEQQLPQLLVYPEKVTYKYAHEVKVQHEVHKVGTYY